MTHLISLGHQRIAFVGINDQRLTGYKHSLFEHGIAYDEQLVNFILPTQSPAESAYEIVIRLIEDEREFSAIFTATDEAAIGAMAALTDKGLRVPQDMALASIDNLDFAKMLRPALTTVELPTRTLAKYAIQALQTHKDYEVDSPVSMVVPTRLIVRNSCGMYAIGAKTET
jgi:LacI family transcriptional regulator